MNDRTRALLNGRKVRELYFANVQRRERSLAYEHIATVHGEELAEMYRDWEQSQEATA